MPALPSGIGSHDKGSIEVQAPGGRAASQLAELREKRSDRFWNPARIVELEIQVSGMKGRLKIIPVSAARELAPKGAARIVDDAR